MHCNPNKRNLNHNGASNLSRNLIESQVLRNAKEESQRISGASNEHESKEFKTKNN